MKKLELPRFAARDTAGQMVELHRYLFRMTEVLNQALSELDGKAVQTEQMIKAVPRNGDLDDEQSQNTFNSIKALIIKSADIINSYSEAIVTELSGSYVAISDFGTFSEETKAKIEETSKGLEALYSNIQTILSDIEGMEEAIIEVNASIRTGLLYYDDSGVPVYGLEIGQKTKMDGEEVFNKFARFTSDRLSFFDQNGNEAAYISDLRLHIRQVKILSVFEQGNFQKTVNSDGSIVTKWVGGGSE